MKDEGLGWHFPWPLNTAAEEERKHSKDDLGKEGWQGRGEVLLGCSSWAPNTEDPGQWLTLGKFLEAQIEFLSGLHAFTIHAVTGIHQWNSLLVKLPAKPRSNHHFLLPSQVSRVASPVFSSSYAVLALPLFLTSTHPIISAHSWNTVVGGHLTQSSVHVSLDSEWATFGARDVTRWYNVYLPCLPGLTLQHWPRV